MTNFDEWLKGIRGTLGGRTIEGAPSLGSANLDEVRNSLRSRLAKNEIYFRIAFGLTVLLAIATAVTTIWDRTATGAWVPATLGVSTAVAVARTMRAVQDKNAFEMMLEIALGLDDEALRAVLGVLLKKFE